MEDKNLFDLWEKGEDMNTNDLNISKQTDNILQLRINRSSDSMLKNLYLYICAQVATITLLGVNISCYWNNSIMLSVIGVLLLMTSGFLVYGFDLLKHYHKTNRSSEDLVTHLKSKISFYYGRYKLWPLFSAISLTILTFAINILTDNQDGSYTINKPVVFILLNLTIITIIFLSIKHSITPTLIETKKCLLDLKKGMDLNIEGLEEKERMYKTGKLMAMILLLIILIAGIIVLFN